MNAKNNEVLASIATGEGCAFELELLDLTAPELEEIALRLDAIETGSSAKDRQSRLYAAHLIGEADQMKRWKRGEKRAMTREPTYEDFILETRPEGVAADLIADIGRYQDELDALGREVLGRPDVREQHPELRKLFLARAIEERFGVEKLMRMKADEIMRQSLILGMAIDIGGGRVKDGPAHINEKSAAA